MSENIQSISMGSYTLGETNKLTFEAGNGIQISEPSAGTVRIGNDETVLFENQTNTTADMILSEPISNFEYFEMYGHWNYNGNQCIRAYNKIWTNSSRGYANVFSLAGYGVGNLAAGSVDYFFCGTDYSANSTTIKVRKCMRNNLQNSLYSSADGLIVDKIIGINRISGSNA